MTGSWRQYPPIEMPAPVLALQAGADGVWAGGLGGVARYSDDRGWLPLLAGLPLRSVTALASDAGSLLAGGDGGIARSLNGGQAWQGCAMPGGVRTLTALALSPRFSQDGAALAATLDNGVLRSTDGGRRWQTSSFGLQSPEVLALAWGAGETVVAATTSGLFRSPNAGRAWRALEPTEGISFVAIALLADGEVLAAPDVGPLLRSSENHTRWTPLGGLPDDMRSSALLAFDGDSILLGTADHGILLSTDGGNAWSPVATESAFCFAAAGTRVYAGIDAGVMVSRDGGDTWSNLPPAPLHDLRRILIVGGVPLIAGTHSPLVLSGADGAWEELAGVPLPLTGLFVAPDGVLFASTPDDLFRSADRGATWEPIVAGQAGLVTQMTFDRDGHGWAGITLSDFLLRTRDGGHTWERLPAPFGVLPLTALQAVSGAGGRLIATTYDARQRAVSLWRSDDGGERWTRGADSFTDWPFVATLGEPPIVAIGTVVTVQLPDGSWRQTTIGESGVLRVASSGAVVFALTVDGLWRSDNHGAIWTSDEAGLPIDQLVDITLAGGVLYALLTGGRLWSRPL